MQHITQKLKSATIFSEKLVKSKILFHISGFFLGFFLSVSPVRGRTSPFGIAAVAAAPFTYLLSTLCGSLLGCLFLGTVSGIRLSSAAFVLAGVRLIFLPSKSMRKLYYFEPLLAASVVLSTGFAMYLSHDLDVFFLIEGLAVFGAAFIFKGGTGAVDKIFSSKKTDNYSKGFFVASLLIIVISTSGTVLYGISIVAILFLVFSAGVSFRGDLAAAGFVGMLTALTLTLSGYSTLGVASGTACLAAALGKKIFPVNAKQPKKQLLTSPIFIYFATAQGVIFLCGGDIIFPVLEIIFATILLLLLPDNFMRSVSNFFEFPSHRTTSPTSSAKILKTAHAIDEIIDGLSVKKQYYSPEVLTKTVEVLCKNCKKSPICWGNSYNTTMDLVNDMTCILKKNSVLTVSNLPPLFTELCLHSSTFAKNATDEYMEYAETVRRQEENRIEKNLLKEHYQNFSAVLSDLGDTLVDERERDITLEERLRELFTQKGANIVNIEASYNRHDKLQISGNSTGSKPDLVRASEMIATITERKISKPEIWKNNTHWHFVVNEEENFGISLERHISPAPGEKVTGDSVRDFKTDDMLYITVICDGMGAGRKASEKSRLAVDYLEKLMLAGLRRESAVRVLNSALLASPDAEVFTTLDAAILDMYSGELEFVKAGAAPSYIMRGSELARVDSQSLPAGIMPSLEAETYHTRVQDKDVIIMMSDGILPMGEDPLPLEAFIKSFDRSKGSLSRALVAYAKTRYFGIEADDMTAVVLTVEKKNGG